MKQSILAFFIFYSFILQAQTPPAKTWYYNDKGAKTTVKERWGENSQGLKNGVYIKYDEKGGRLVYGNYVNGKKQGRWEEVETYDAFLSSSNYLIVSNWKDDKRNGEYKRIKTGELGLQSLFGGGIDGTSILVDIGQYSDGFQTGYWKEDYDKEQTLFKEGNYINGKRNGEWKNTAVTIGADGKLVELWGIIMLNTKKNYRTIFKVGDISAAYDDKGVNLIAKAQQEEFDEQLSQEFSNCSTISDFESFRRKYPDSPFDSEAIVEINNLKKKEQDVVKAKKKEDDYLNPLITQWKSLPDTAITFAFFNEYYKQFPNGYRITEVHNMLELDKQRIGSYMDALHGKHEKNWLSISDKTVKEQYQYNHIRLNKNTNDIGVYDELFKRYPKVEFPELDKWLKQKVEDKRIQYKFQVEELIYQNTESSLKTALAMLNVINRYSSSLHNSAALPFSIQRSLLNWKLGHIELAIKEIELHKDDIIEYSDGDVKYSKKFKELYKDYKIGYPEEKASWNKISSILEL